MPYNSAGQWVPSYPAPNWRPEESYNWESGFDPGLYPPPPEFYNESVGWDGDMNPSSRWSGMQAQIEAERNAAALAAARAASAQSTSRSGGGGGSSRSYASAPAPKIYTARELADLYGVHYDYDYILNMLNEASDAKFKELDSQAKTLRENRLRESSGLYTQYLDALRSAKDNAVKTGVNKGTQAAQELSAMLGTQGIMSQEQTGINQDIMDLYNKAETERQLNKSLAETTYNETGKYLGTLSTNLNANDVQRYAADLAARAAASAGSSGGYSSASSGGSGGSTGYTNNDIQLIEYLKGHGYPLDQILGFTNAGRANK